MTDHTDNKPNLYAYAVRETDHTSYFTKIGAAFAHTKRQGFTVDLSAHPLDNKIVLLPPKEEDETENSTPTV